ncbi:MAG TPA: energy transducer TonB [Rhizomicrobium sp.]|nr:energy transducer TonB [Rhizomicrobium sp.]
MTGGLLTALLYALFALLVWRASLAPRSSPVESEIVATLLPDVPKKRAVEPLPPFLAHLIRPRAEKPAPPVFTIASGAPPQAPAPLPASAAKTSPMPGGTSGNGPMGQAASGNGTGGNGAGLAGCLDPAWLRAVTERVRQFFYYPDAALAVHSTGVVMMHFSVHRDGQIDRLKISRSSGNDGLDKAATDIMRKAQPLPPIPDRMHTDRVEGDLPINFGVRSFNGGASAGNCRG